MAASDGNKPKKKWQPLRYFYLNGNLHKKLLINRGADTIVAWCYPEHRRVAYTYSDVRVRKEPAFTTAEVAEMLGRHPRHLERVVRQGHIVAPQFTYGLDENKAKYKYMWSESDIMRAHEYFSSVHRGRPRNDGLVTNTSLPTARELRAMIRQEQVFYVKNENGEFVPTWRAQDFS